MDKEMDPDRRVYPYTRKIAFERMGNLNAIGAKRGKELYIFVYPDELCAMTMLIADKWAIKRGLAFDDADAIQVQKTAEEEFLRCHPLDILQEQIANVVAHRRKNR